MIAHAQGKKWREELITYPRAYRTTLHATTGRPPGEVFFSRPIRTKRQEICEIVPNDREFKLNDGEYRD